jgi:hypothetical protein
MTPHRLRPGSLDPLRADVLLDRADRATITTAVVVAVAVLVRVVAVVAADQAQVTNPGWNTGKSKAVPKRTAFFFVQK